MGKEIHISKLLNKEISAKELKKGDKFTVVLDEGVVGLDIAMRYVNPKTWMVKEIGEEEVLGDTLWNAVGVETSKEVIPPANIWILTETDKVIKLD